MYEYFLDLPPDKQQRIVSAAMREFGRYGYQKTSAEQIAQSAGIGKGMLFRYFGSKKGLFEYLVAYTMDFLSRWFGDLFAEMDGLDYIAQYRLMTRIKLRAYQENAGAFEFLAVLLLHPENLSVSDRAKAMYDEITALRAKALAALSEADNTFCFRTDMDAGKIKKYVAWMVEGYTQELLAVFAQKPLAETDTEPYWAEFDNILDDLKRLFYQPR